MIEWYLDVSRQLREIRKKSIDAFEALENDDGGGARVINSYLKTDYANLRRVWELQLESNELGYLGRHIHFGMKQDYTDILKFDVPAAEEKAEGCLLENQKESTSSDIEGILHPVVYEHAYHQLVSGQLRDAVLNSFIAVFDLIRDRTGLDLDGVKLVGHVFSLKDPMLILSDLETDSGRSDQNGFLQIFQGAFTGIRNPKAHSLSHDLTHEKAAQYLVFASLLARRVDEASEP